MWLGLPEGGVGSGQEEEGGLAAEGEADRGEPGDELCGEREQYGRRCSIIRQGQYLCINTFCAYITSPDCIRDPCNDLNH